MSRKTGFYEKLGNFDSFIPNPLPPHNPSFHMDSELTDLYGQTMHALGQLNEVAQRLPNAQRFIKAYVIKEALLSSAIEGIHTTLIDVFTQPLLDVKPNKDTQLVINYTQALEVALNMMQNEGLPISSRIILGTHKALMSYGEGDKADPGNYRRQPVRVGNLVPPPANHISALMADLERYINEDDSLPPLIKAGLAHVQFETIHPFLDGNGRIGRLLIVLMLIDSNLLKTPILYPSYYFKKHHMEYYKKLDSVRLDGDFEGWTRYYLQAIKESCQDAYNRIQEIEKLEQHISTLIQSEPQFNKVQEQALNTLTILFGSPVISINALATQLTKSYNTASNLINIFVECGILQETTEQKRNKLYRFQSYLDVLEKEL